MKTTSRTVFRLPFFFLFTLICAVNFPRPVIAEGTGGYDKLLLLFEEWREFESPPLLDRAPDYTADRFRQRYIEFQALQERLNTLEIDNWPVPQQVDWHLVRAEMNGFEFNHRVLQPWARDPAFYDTVSMARSDVPAHEGQTNHAVVELWTYDFPLSDKEEARLISELRAIPPLMKQAQRNLTGNARDLWVTGIRDIRAQNSKLDELTEMAAVSSSDELMAVINRSRQPQTSWSHGLKTRHLPRLAHPALVRRTTPGISRKYISCH
jgi:hypothetical protein